MKNDYFTHSQAIVESSSIGSGTRIWAFAHILPGASIGNECNICDHVFIENGVTVGDRVTVKCGVQLWEGVTIEDDVFIGPNVTFTNDDFPRSKHYPDSYLKTRVCQGASIGANATILPGITIGSKAMVGAGAVVVKDIPPNAIVIGNPAKIIGYVDTHQHPDSPISHSLPPSLRVKNAKVYHMPLIKDLRGSLTVGEINKHLPFCPKRYFLIYDVPSQEVRGAHAHKTLHEFLICLKGSCSVALDDGYYREEVVLNSPTIGLHLPPLVWGVQYKYSKDAILLVLASEVYEADDYIRNYDEYIKMIKSEKV